MHENLKKKKKAITTFFYFEYFKINSNSSIDSIVQFPSLSDSIKASFVFIEHGRELTLCASLCKTTFPDPDAILHIFRVISQEFHSFLCDGSSRKSLFSCTFLILWDSLMGPSFSENITLKNRRQISIRFLLDF